MVDQPKPKSLRDRMYEVCVSHPVFENALDDVNFYISQYDPAGTAPPPSVPIVGPSGVGKSTLFDTLKKQYPVVPNARVVKSEDGSELVCDHVPILCITIPETISIKVIASLMLKALGDPRWNKDTLTVRTERLDKYLCWCGTAAVLYDESQRVLDRTGALTAEEFIDWIKDRHKAARAAFFLIGLPHVSDLFTQDTQFDRRWLAEIELLPYRWGEDTDSDLSERYNFMGLLLALRDASPVPFAPEVDVEDENVAKRFYYASRGTAGMLKEKLLCTAMMICTRREMQNKPVIVDFQVLSEAFDKAFRKRSGDVRLINPFTAGWDGRLPPPIQNDNYLTAAAKQRRKRERRSTRRRIVEEAFSKR